MERQEHEKSGYFQMPLGRVYLYNIFNLSSWRGLTLAMHLQYYSLSGSYNQIMHK